ncbi:putative cytochrome P450 6a17 isoform X2 [Rhynchophorus ferrugineus]|uniref:putative cytochrome P450 6a17 isoform X2 n=1 Tax=Rhynchophorus ferrugineus TaxID=354439 RepID=UPI003FCC9422
MIIPVLASICVLILTIWFYIKNTLSYWSRRGVIQIENKHFWSRELFGTTIRDKYQYGKSLNQKYIGTYIFSSPVFFPIHPPLIKNVIQHDFSHFRGHGNYNEPKDILSMHLFNVEGEIWKNLRVKLTPTFTSGKIKMMFETLLEKTHGLEKVVGDYADRKAACDIKDVLGRFTTDVIGSCAFGIECNSLEEPDNDFRCYGKKVFERAPSRLFYVIFIPHWILMASDFKFHGKEVTDFFTNLVKSTIKYRQDNNIVRKDFLQLLIQNDSVTVDEIIAQCFVFFLAGFETSSTAMTFALFELASNQHIQKKLREEIEEVLKKFNGNLTYDAVIEMKYLDMVVNETLRKFPPAASIPRVCSKRYKVPDSDLVIEKGVRVQIPVWGLHMDPEYYPDPEVFNPENFSEENRNKRPDFTFLPFGEGPRMCIGMRFGLLQTKVGLISLIRNFHFTLNEKTKTPLEMERGSIVLVAKGDIWLNVKRI